MSEVIERNGRLLTIDEFEQEIRSDERTKVINLIYDHFNISKEDLMAYADERREKEQWRQ